MEIDYRVRLKTRLYQNYGRCDKCKNVHWHHHLKGNKCQFEDNVFVGDYNVVKGYKVPLTTCKNWKQKENE